MKRARLEYNGAPTWGRLEGSQIILEDGSAIAEASARYLPPVVPSKILATHLSYYSRCREYQMRKLPDVPSYFLKPLSSLSSHRATVARPRGCRFLNYEG